MNTYSRNHGKKNVIHTTLFEVIEAIDDAVRQEEKKHLPEIIAKFVNGVRSNCRVEGVP